MNEIDTKLFDQQLKSFLKNPAVIDGGLPVRESPFPCRDVSNKQALDKIKQVFEHYWAKNQDIPYQADFESVYCDEFSEYHGGGYADAVSSGSVAVYIALKLLDLPHNAKIAVSPVTDPGAISAVLFAGLIPVLVDSEKGQFNISATTLKETLEQNSDVSAIMLTHVGGIPLNMLDVMKVANKYDLDVVEDCSQAHGAEVNGQKIGTFGRVAAYSTMFTKNHSTGSSGGVVLCSTKDDYWEVRSLADRKKPFSDPNFNPRAPGSFLGPGLNFNSNEIACALGSLSLEVLDKTIDERQKKVDLLTRLLFRSKLFSPLSVPLNVKTSYFFCTLVISNELSEKVIEELKDVLVLEGVSLNVDYKYVVSEWGWLKRLMPNLSSTPNATNLRKRSVNVLFHEKYSDADIKDLALVIYRAEHQITNKNNIDFNDSLVNLTFKNNK